MAVATMDDFELAARLKKADIGSMLDEHNRIIEIYMGVRANVDQACPLVAKARWVREIDANPSDMTDEGLRHLKDLPHLTALFLSDTTVTGKGLEVLLTLPKLERLSCSPQVDADEGLSYIGQVVGLRDLTLQEARISDAGLAFLSHLSELEYLSLAKTDVGPGVAVVEQFPKLRQLNLVDTKIDDAVLESVGRVRTLRKLWLQHQEITDVGLRHLRQLEVLESFGFDGTVTAEGLAYLARLSRLDSLYLDGVKGLDSECFDVLIGMTQLKHLEVREGEVIPGELARFERRRPDCDVLLLPARKSDKKGSLPQ